MRHSLAVSRAIVLLATLVLAPSSRAADGGAGGLAVGPEIAVMPLVHGPLNYVSGGHHLACGPERCLALWGSATTPGDYSLQMAEGVFGNVIDASGGLVHKAAFPISGIRHLGSTPVVWTGRDFAVVSTKADGLFLVRVSVQGEVGARLPLRTNPSADRRAGWPALARNGARYLAVWSEGPETGLPPRTLWAQALDDSLAVVSTPVELGETDVLSQLWALRRGDGFLVIAGKIAYDVGPDGARRLGPQALPVTGDLQAVTEAGAEPVLALRDSSMSGLARLGPMLTTAVTVPTTIDLGAALAWNGTHLLLINNMTSPMGARRYSAALQPVDAQRIPLPAAAAAGHMVAAARGEEFAVVHYRTNRDENGYPQVDGFLLDSAARPRSPAVLVSATALPETFPRVAATPRGFLAACAAGVRRLEVAALDADGRRVGSGTVVQTAAIGHPAVAVGAQNALITWLDAQPVQWRGARFDLMGAPLDPLPVQLRWPAGEQYAESAAAIWNGEAFVVAARQLEVMTIRPDGMRSAWSTIPSTSGVTRMGMATAGTTTLLAWAHGNWPQLPAQPRAAISAVRVDRAGQPIDATPIQVAAPWSPAVEARSFAIASGASRFLVAWEQANTSAPGRVTSELRARRVGMDGSLLDPAPLVVRTVTGLPMPPPTALPGVLPPTQLGTAFDGQRFWIVWSEQGAAWARRLGTDGSWVDAQPARLFDAETIDLQIASRGDGRVLLAYVRPDHAPDVRALRMVTRLATTADRPLPPPPDAAPTMPDGAPSAGDAARPGDATDAARAGDAGPVRDAAVGDGAALDGATGAPDAAIAPGDAPAGNPGADATGSGGKSGTPNSGCGCRLGDTGEPSAGLLALGLMAIAGCLRRRRISRRCPGRPGPYAGQ